MSKDQARLERKLYLFMSVSVDGYFEGPGHDLSWHRVDREFNRFAIGQMAETDLFLWGRRTYQLMEGYWPKVAQDTSASKDNLKIADLMNNTEKIVFSRTLPRAEETRNWRNVKLLRRVDPAAIRRLKKRPGKDIGVGGSDLAVSLAEAGLIDEFRLMVTPVALGDGTPIFRGLKRRLDLELGEARRFESGNLLLYYRPAKAKQIAEE